MISHLRSVRRPLRRFAAVLICLLGSGQAVGADNPDAEIYMAQVHASNWTFKGSGPVCELTHEIPQFGLARFLRVAGENLVFRIDSYQPVPERVEATLREVSPDWHHTPPDALEQQVVVASGRHPISLDRRPAGWLLSSLAKGQIGSFDLLDWNDSRKPLHIRLSPVKFQQPYREFKQCVSRLAGKGYESLRHTTIHFDTDVHRLDPASRRTLEGLAGYVKTVGGIKAVSVSGFADDRGKSGYNMRLSARRAKSVADFLVARGSLRRS